jgi:hypothetical protein
MAGRGNPNPNEGEDTGDERLDIMGGPGAYWFAGSFKGHFQRRYANATGGSVKIEVWTSDQGFAAEERYICKEIQVVIRAARFFAEFGDFDPSVTWEN